MAGVETPAGTWVLSRPHIRGLIAERQPRGDPPFDTVDHVSDPPQADRAEAGRGQTRAVSLAADQAHAFFGHGDGDELTMQFDFPTMQAMYLALAREDPGPIRSALMGRPANPHDA